MRAKLPIKSLFFKVARALAAALIVVGTAVPAGADVVRDCGSGIRADRRIAACTEIIGKGGTGAMGLPAAYTNRGRGYLDKLDYERALAEFDAAIRIDPKFSLAYASRSRAYGENHDYERGIADADEAIRLDPGSARAYNIRGLNYKWKNEFDRAISDFTASIVLDPTFASTPNNRGNAYRAKGEFDRAISDYEQAIRLNPKFLLAYSNRASAYQAKGDLERALADYLKVLELPARLASDRQRQSSARERIELLSKPQPAPSNRRVALVIGNSNYQRVGLLANPANDARAVAVALRRLGFAEVVELFDLDQAAMTRALKDFGDRAQGAEWAVVFFAGHGLEMNGTNYLVPVDAQLKRDAHVADEALSLDSVQAKVDAASKFGLIILDACRNNPFIASMARTRGATRSVGQGLATIADPEGNVLVAFAAKHGTVAEDGAGQHSPFTAALLAHLEEPGLEVNILFRKIRDAVRTSTQRRQDPFVYGSLGSELLFFKSATAR